MFRPITLASISTLALLAAAAPAQVTRAIFLLDRSGSMGALTQSGTSTRCIDSLALCRDEIELFFDNAINTGQIPEAMVVRFDAGANFYRPVNAVGIYPTGTAWPPTSGVGSYWLTTKVDALTAATNSPTYVGSCGPGTQLADSICRMVSDMEARIAANPTLVCTSYFYVYSDGGENASTGNPCSGPWDTNLTGRCPCDSSSTGTPFVAGTWQRLACDRICNMAGCFIHAVFNARKFNSFSTDAPTLSEQRVFRFLDTQAGQTGGSSLAVDDATGYVAGSGSPLTVLAGGCASPSGQTLVLNPTATAQVNNSFSMQLLGSTWLLKFITLGFAQLPAPVQFPLAPAGCHIVIQPDIVYMGTLVPNLTIPNNPSLAGANLFFQGLATDLAGSWTTSNGLKMTIQP